MEVKNKNFKLTLGVCKKVPDIAVVMSIPFKGCPPCCLKKLRTNSPAKSPSLMTGSENASLAFALFECIRDKMIGSPLETARSKVSQVKCKSLNDNFVIYWNCYGTGSSLRKTLSLAISCLMPHKLYSKYKENMKFLGGSAPREHFNHCAKQMINSIKKEVHIAVVGKINTDKKKLEEILKKTSIKLPILSSTELTPAEIPPTRVSDEKGKIYPHVKCSDGITCIVLADYINSNSGGMGVEIHTGLVEIYNDGWETKKKQLNNSKKITQYVKQKYENKSISSMLSELLAYNAISRCYADSSTISKLILKGINTPKVKEMIKKAIS